VPLLAGLENDAGAVRRAAAVGLVKLAEVANSAPLRFRAALPVLERVSRTRMGDRDVSRACRAAMTLIEERTAGLRDLPLPSMPGAPDGSNLPRSADAAAQPAEDVPRITDQARSHEPLAE